MVITIYSSFDFLNSYLEKECAHLQKIKAGCKYIAPRHTLGLFVF